MKESIDANNAPIDDLIQWVRTLRKLDPLAPLSRLLQNHSIQPSRMVEIACIDLVERRRLGHPILIEDYLVDLPCLAESASTLDLIDAQLCMDQELKVNSDIDGLIHRFPTIASQIRELSELDSSGLTVMDPLRLDSMSIVPPSLGLPVGSGATLIEKSDLPEQPLGRSSWGPHPIDIPDWFLTENCVASSPGRWLIRGRDSAGGTLLALKVTELSPLVTPSQSSCILDTCEEAAKVGNPQWACPSMAAIQDRHLGVIRPWILGSPWNQVMPSLDRTTQLRRLASVAFTLASGHKADATHGGIHAENLVVDHAGKVCLVDAASSRVGLARWLRPDGGSTDEIVPLVYRIQGDIQDLIKLVTLSSVDWSSTWTQTLMQELQRVSTSASGDASYQIGSILIQHADRGVPENCDSIKYSWRIRLASWLLRDTKG